MNHEKYKIPYMNKNIKYSNFYLSKTITKKTIILLTLNITKIFAI